MAAKTIEQEMTDSLNEIGLNLDRIIDAKREAEDERDIALGRIDCLQAELRDKDEQIKRMQTQITELDNDLAALQ